MEAVEEPLMEAIGYSSDDEDLQNSLEHKQAMSKNGDGNNEDEQGSTSELKENVKMYALSTRKTRRDFLEQNWIIQTDKGNMWFESCLRLKGERRFYLELEVITEKKEKINSLIDTGATTSVFGSRYIEQANKEKKVRGEQYDCSNLKLNELRQP
jgi:hypothetical protein